MILMFSYPFVVVFSSSENNNKSAQKRNGNWTAREMPLVLFLSFFSLSVAGKEEELKQFYIYLKRVPKTLSNSLTLSRPSEKGLCFRMQ